MYFNIIFALVLSSAWANPTAITVEEEDYSAFYDDFIVSTGYVAGGTGATKGSHPHMAVLSLGFPLRFIFCGGSIVTSRTILTAAHCVAHAYVDGELSKSLRIIVGTNYWEKGGNTYSISYNVTHPQYIPKILKNDIGILVTTSEITMTDVIRPIQLDYTMQEAGVPVRVAGWGKTGPDSSASDSLQELNMTTISDEQCINDVIKAGLELHKRPPPVLPDIEICAIHTGGRTCKGDSGSALVRVDNGKQIGIVSWSFPCGYQSPDMFARVSAFREWLEKVIV